MDILKKQERIMKGAANHWRIRVLYLLEKQPGLSVWAIAEAVNGSFKTIAEHLRRLAAAGLITKRYHGKMVGHVVTPLGESVIRFLRMLE